MTTSGRRACRRSPRRLEASRRPIRSCAPRALHSGKRWRSTTRTMLKCLPKHVVARTFSEVERVSEADRLIARLGLSPHPEGGHFRETFRDQPTASGRAASTAIFYLLKKGERSHWHRIDAVEIWHWYAGAPLELGLSTDGTSQTVHVLGNDIGSGQSPQCVVPVRWWQSARTLGEFTLVGCTVAPGFEFGGFEMAPPGWQPANTP